MTIGMVSDGRGRAHHATLARHLTSVPQQPLIGLTLSILEGLVDGDVFTRKVRGRWRRVAEAMRDGNLEACGDSLEAVLAKVLRDGGGLKALDELRSSHRSHVASAEDVAAALERLFLCDVVDRIGPTLIGHGIFKTFDDVHLFATKATKVANLDSLAGRALVRPDGQGIRKSPKARPGLAMLLREAAPLGPRV